MKRFLCGLMSVIMLFCVVPVNAKAANNESKITNQATGFLKACKNYTPLKIAKYFQPAEYRKAFPVWNNKKMQKVVSKVQNDHFKYTITDVSIKGKRASVTVNVDYYDLWDEVLDSMIYCHKKNYSFRSDAFANRILKLYKENSKKNGSASCIHTTVKIPMIKRNGKWMVQKMTKQMNKISDAGSTASFDYIFMHQSKYF